MVGVGRAHDRYGSAAGISTRRYGRGQTREVGGVLVRFKQVRVGLGRVVSAGRGPNHAAGRRAPAADPTVDSEPADTVDAVDTAAEEPGEHPAGRDVQDVPYPLR